MARIMCTWELGAALGHVARLFSISRQLIQDQHELSLTLRDLSGCKQYLHALPINLIQAPVFLPRLKMNRQLASLADVLALTGYRRSDTLVPILMAWKTLFESFRPELLILDHSPGALLAAQLYPCRKIIIGNGFTLPVPGANLKDWRVLPTGDNAVLEQEGRVVEVINEALAMLGSLNEISRLSDIYQCDSCVISTFPVLDLYADERLVNKQLACYCSENPQDFPDVQPLTATGQAKIVCYLNPAYKPLALLLQALAQCPAEVTVVCPGAEANNFSSLARPGFSLITELVNLEVLIAQSALVITHGGIGTTTQSMRLGKPLLLLPLQLEQLNTGVLLQKQGLAKIVPEHDSVRAYLDAINVGLNDKSSSSKAIVFAEENRQYCQQSLATVVREQVARLV